MGNRGLLIALSGLLVLLMGAGTASAQCASGIDNLAQSDLEYFGALPGGDHAWTGQSFTTDCDGQFLSVTFLVVAQLFDFNGVRPLGPGDTVTCTIMDSLNRPIASVDQILSAAIGTEQVTFSFASLALGLAAGTLGVKIDTPHDAYGRLGATGDVVPGNLLVFDGSTLFQSSGRDAGFAVGWDPNAVVVGNDSRSWGEVKALFR